MKRLPITQRDQELISAAAQAIKNNYIPGRHRVGAAVRGKSGRVYTGIHVDSNAIDVCAEWVAIGTAMTNGERELASIVAVIKKSEEDEPEVISPCGVCRELIRTYGGETEVLFVEDGEVSKCNVEYLLPGAYLPPGKNGEISDSAGVSWTQSSEVGEASPEILALKVTADLGSVTEFVRSTHANREIDQVQRENLKHRIRQAIEDLGRLAKIYGVDW